MPTNLITKHSTTAGNAPNPSELELAELAVNVTDQKLYSKNNSGAVILLSEDTSLLNVKVYGAKGDGVTDDTVAIKACTDAAILANKGVYLPAGNYVVTDNIYNYDKLADGGRSVRFIGEGRGKSVLLVSGAVDYLFKAYGDTTSYGNSSHPSGFLFKGFTVTGDYTNTQNIFDLAMLSYFTFEDVNTFQCAGTNLRMRECWEGDVSGLRVVRGGTTNVYAIILDFFFALRKADSACNNINFGKDFQCESSAWSAIYWGRNTRKCMFSGKIHPLLSATYTVPAFVLDGATNNTIIGANISWKNVKALRITNASNYIPSENIITNNTISGGVEIVGGCRRNTIVYNTGGISKLQNAYIALSLQTVFPYTFLAAAEKNVLVTRNGAELVLTTNPADPKDYTLSGIGNAGGGNVTLTTAGSAGDDVVISPVEDEFVTLAGGADNIVFGNNPSGSGIEVTYASGSNFLPTVFHGKDTVATFNSNDIFARVQFTDNVGTSRVGTKEGKLFLESDPLNESINSKVSLRVHDEEIGKFDANGFEAADGKFTASLTRGTSGWYTGSGTPEGSVTAVVGSIYTRTDGVANETFYVKESGTGNTGWAAK